MEEDNRRWRLHMRFRDGTRVAYKGFTLGELTLILAKADPKDWEWEQL
jgi:hypothetical protein